jgi:lipopolysaccharide export system permease protein
VGKVDKYIIKKFLVTFFFAITIFTAIAVVWDVAEKLDNFLDSEATVYQIIFEYYTSFIPYIAILLSPLFVFIAVVYFTSRMAAKSEIIAILSSGMSFYRMLVPYFIAAAFLAFLILIANHWFFPKANEARISFENTYIRHPYVNTDRHIHMKLDTNTYVYVKHFNIRDTFGMHFTLEKINDQQLNEKLYANRIEWVAKEEKWRLKKYKHRKYDEHRETVTKGKEKMMKLNLYPKDFGRKKDIVDAMTTPELNKFIAEQKLKGSERINFFLVKKHQRTSTPFATFILTLIAVALSSRKVRGGTGLHIALGFLIAFSYIFFMRFSVTLSTNANFPPLLGVWTPNLLYLVLAGVLTKYAPK